MYCCLFLFSWLFSFQDIWEWLIISAVTAPTHYFQFSWELWISPLTRWNNQNREMKHSETQVHITILWVPLTVVSAIGLSIFICPNWRIIVLLAQTRRIRDKRRRQIYDTQSSKLFLALKIICLDNILILSLEYVWRWSLCTYLFPTTLSPSLLFHKKTARQWRFCFKLICNLLISQSLVLNKYLKFRATLVHCTKFSSVTSLETTYTRVAKRYNTIWHFV